MSEAWTQWEGHVVHGGFRLQKYLGGSSRSAVFLAEHHGPVSRRAAIKLIPANCAESALYLSRWGHAENLSHPHLIRLIDKGRCQLGSTEMLFVAMEYAEENLADILSERALTPAEVRDLLLPTLDALTYLHDRGFVHGHLKPANVLAAGDELKLASDGLCAPGEAMPEPGMPNAYDPPEKAVTAASPASDVWSLGMTLAEALTQQVPAWIEKEEADPVVSEGMPAPFLDIVRGCLRRDPRRRLTLAEIASRLRPTPQPAREVAPSKAPVIPQQGSPSTPSQLMTGIQLRVPQRSLIGPTIIAALTVTVLFGGLGLLHRQPDTRPSASAAKSVVKREVKAEERSLSKSVLPLNQDGGNVSRSKPSPVAGRQEASLPFVNRSAASPATATDHTGDVGDVVREVLPNVPESARNTIQGTIRVGITVQVDPSGNVVGTEMTSPGPSRFFARLAVEAAQNWRFSPVPQSAEREFVIQFAFTNTEIKAFATRGP